MSKLTGNTCPGEDVAEQDAHVREINSSRLLSSSVFPRFVAKPHATRTLFRPLHGLLR